LLDVRRDVQALPPSSGNLALRGELAALLTSIATLYEEPSIIIQEAQEALTYLPEEDLVSRARVNVALGTAYAYTDETQNATGTFDLARDLALKARNPFLTAAAIELLAGMQIYHQGCLREGARTLQQVLDLGSVKGGTHLPFTETAHVLLAEVYLEWNDLDAAAGYLHQGIELMQQGGIGYSFTHTYCVQARLRQALGNRAGAIDALRQAAQASKTYPMLHFIIHQAAYQVRLALWLGNIETAALWARGNPDTIGRALPDNLAPICVRCYRSRKRECSSPWAKQQRYWRCTIACAHPLGPLAGTRASSKSHYSRRWLYRCKAKTVRHDRPWTSHCHWLGGKDACGCRCLQ
jgi:ATP/maltotriose-dependent transcriptional regulator MalT